MAESSQHHPTTNPSNQQDTDSLTILLVSDIHNGFKQLDMLKSWYEQNPHKFDYVFATGDFDVLRIVPKEAITDKNNDYTMITKILTYLEHFSSQIVYIPGNHDPIGLFNEEKPLTQKSVSVQNCSLKIRDDLQVIGLGGSLPGFFDKDNKLEINLDSYPYSNEEELKEDLQRVVQKHCKEDVQTIFLTHTGPYCSSTSTIYLEKKECNLLLGSKELEKTLKDQKLNILVNIHGHVHCSIGRTNIGKVQILNPGSVFEKDFGILSLKRRKTSGKWFVEKSEFISLENFVNDK